MWITLIDALLIRELFRYLGYDAEVLPVVRIIMHTELRGVPWLAGVAPRVAWLQVMVNGD
jgi:hypothetical protein